MKLADKSGMKVLSRVALFISFFVFSNSWGIDFEEHLKTKGVSEINRSFGETVNPTPPLDFASDKLKRFCSSEDLDAAQLTGEYYDVYKHQNLPIYYMHFNDSKIQDLALDRMVTFAAYDKAQLNPKTILTPEYAGDDGMDIKGEHVALFYSKMAKAHHPLTNPEKRLLQNLLKTGDLKEQGAGQYTASHVFALVSTSQDSSPSTCRHEFRHAVYATVPAYREKVIEMYKGLSPTERRLADRILGTMGHTKEKGLETYYTEFGAYLRDPDSLVSDYPDKLKFTDEERKSLDEIKQRLERLENALPAFRSCTSLSRTSKPPRSSASVPKPSAESHR